MIVFHERGSLPEERDAAFLDEVGTVHTLRQTFHDAILSGTPVCADNLGTHAGKGGELLEGGKISCMEVGKVFDDGRRLSVVHAPRVGRLDDEHVGVYNAKICTPGGACVRAQGVHHWGLCFTIESVVL